MLRPGRRTTGTPKRVLCNGLCQSRCRRLLSRGRSRRQQYVNIIYKSPIRPIFWGVPSLLHHLPRARQANCPATAAHGAHTVCAFRQRSTAYSCHSVLEDADSQHINYLCHSKIAGLSTPIFSTQCIVYGFGRAIVLSSATPPAARSVLRPRPHPLSSRHGGRATSFLIYIYTICPLHFSAKALFNTQVINDAAPLSPADHGSYAQHPPMMWARLPGCCFGCGVSAFVGGGVYTAYCVAAKI